MSLWKILTSPGGVEGCRASMESAVKLNIKRANQGSPFARRGVAVSSALINRYRVVRQPFDPEMMLFEAAPLAWPDETRVSRIVAEYVVDQEFPGKAAVWLGEMMPDLLHDFVSAEDYEVKGVVGGIFLGMTTDRLMPHWGKWLRRETLELIYDVAREHLNDRHPHLFSTRSVVDRVLVMPVEEQRKSPFVRRALKVEIVGGLDALLSGVAVDRFTTAPVRERGGSGGGT